MDHFSLDIYMFRDLRGLNKGLRLQVQVVADCEFVLGFSPYASAEMVAEGDRWDARYLRNEVCWLGLVDKWSTGGGSILFLVWVRAALDPILTHRFPSSVGCCPHNEHYAGECGKIREERIAGQSRAWGRQARTNAADGFGYQPTT